MSVAFVKNKNNFNINENSIRNSIVKSNWLGKKVQLESAKGAKKFFTFHELKKVIIKSNTPFSEQSQLLSSLKIRLRNHKNNRDYQFKKKNICSYLSSPRQLLIKNNITLKDPVTKALNLMPKPPGLIWQNRVGPNGLGGSILLVKDQCQNYTENALETLIQQDFTTLLNTIGTFEGSGNIRHSDRITGTLRNYILNALIKKFNQTNVKDLSQYIINFPSHFVESRKNEIINCKEHSKCIWLLLEFYDLVLFCSLTENEWIAIQNFLS